MALGRFRPPEVPQPRDIKNRDIASRLFGWLPAQGHLLPQAEIPTACHLTYSLPSRGGHLGRPLRASDLEATDHPSRMLHCAVSGLSVDSQQVQLVK